MSRRESPLPSIDPAHIAERMVAAWPRVILFGDRGIGKSTLAQHVARHLAARGVPLSCIGADPGTPAFGLPGAVTLAVWERDAWRVRATEPLCTLDAGRFRLPLVQAVRRLLSSVETEHLIVDTPGVVRGVAGAELLTGLADAVRPTALAVLCAPGVDPPLLAELRALGCELARITPDPGAARPNASDRMIQRTAAWNAHLEHAGTIELALPAVRWLGIPPPLAAADAWPGRQVALYQMQSLLALGEVVEVKSGTIVLRADARARHTDTILVRDARRRGDGLLATAVAPPAGGSIEVVGAADPDAQRREGHRPVTVDAGAFAVTLVNGVLGDPLVMVRLRGRRRIILLDLGEANALSRRLMHRVTDVFVSHAHFDHIAGFLRLLRARMGSVVPPCRLYGPPGLHRHIAGLVDGICWDRIGDAGPEFIVGEVRDELIDWVRIKAGSARTELDATPVVDGCLLDDADLSVRAIVLDHGIPVLSFAVETRGARRIRQAQLATAGLAPGPWLGELKRALAAGALLAEIVLPDGRCATVAALANSLVSETPPVRLVYATDLADTPANRRRLEAHARAADVLVCESPFIDEDAQQARRTQHLTARACGEIAAAARVRRLVPFHFSRRYDDRPGAVYAEVTAASSGVSVHVFDN